MNKKNIAYYINYLSTQLLPTYKDKSLCIHYAWLLLETIHGATKTQLILTGEHDLSEKQQTTLKEWLDLLINQKMPIQYIIGSVPFNELDILVESPVLIPRPETEEWVADLIKRLKKLNNQTLHILDMATGSGCIALALAHHFPHATIVAADISPTALALAHKNKIKNNITNVSFIQSDLFEHIPHDSLFDMIVSNPPYIADQDKQSMDESVLRWEDHGALFSEDNGLAIIKTIIDTSPAYIKPNQELRDNNIAQLWIEIGHEQGPSVQKYMLAKEYNNVNIYKDLEKKDRVVVGRIDYVANSIDTE